MSSLGLILLHSQNGIVTLLSRNIADRSQRIQKSFRAQSIPVDQQKDFSSASVCTNLPNELSTRSQPPLGPLDAMTRTEYSPID